MAAERPKAYFTDGEGPLVLKDLARDISLRRLRPHMFDTISMWVAAESQKPDSLFSPGDTLSVVVPHLLLHNVTDNELAEESRKTNVTYGAIEHVTSLKEDGWNVRVISTAYNVLWDTVGTHVGVNSNEVASTSLNLKKIGDEHFTEPIAQEIHIFQNEILEFQEFMAIACEQLRTGHRLSEIFSDPRMMEISKLLSALHLDRLNQWGFSSLEVSPTLNARRKVEEIDRFTNQLSLKQSDVVYVGDSITDTDAIKFVSQSGGLAIAFNGDENAIRYANIAVASMDARSIRPIVDAWFEGDMEKVQTFIEEQKNPIAQYHVVTPDNQDEIAAVHRAAKLKTRGSSSSII